MATNGQLRDRLWAGTHGRRHRAEPTNSVSRNAFRVAPIRVEMPFGHGDRCGIEVRTRPKAGFDNVKSKVAIAKAREGRFGRGDFTIDVTANTVTWGHSWPQTPPVRRIHAEA